MTVENNFFYYEDAEVLKTKGGLYRVKLEDVASTFYIRPELIEQISLKADVDAELIAILLSYIEYARKCRNSDNKKKAKRIEDKDLFIGINTLLFNYSIETLIDLIRPLKWHEISAIINADNPTEEMEKIM